MCHYTTLWLWIMGDLPGHGKQNQRLCYLMLQSNDEYQTHWPCSEHPSIPWLTLCLWFTWSGTASWNFLVTSSECQRKSLLEDILCTSQPLAKGDLVDHVLHTLPMYKDFLGIMKDQCKDSRLPHLLMIVVHGETLWSPAPQPMDDDDECVLLNLISSAFGKLSRRIGWLSVNVLLSGSWGGYSHIKDDMYHPNGLDFLTEIPKHGHKTNNDKGGMNSGMNSYWN